MIIVYIVLGLIVILLLGATLMPSNFNIEKTIVINRDARHVMQFVGDLNNYSKWNPWQQMDPGSVKNITGEPFTPGHKYEWQGKKVGVGNLTVNSIDDKHIHLDIQFLKPFKSSAKDNWLFEPWGDGSQTKVTWQNNGGLPWPMGRLMGPVINKNLNHQFEKGLQNLKTSCEA
jgi:hypothetical protein